MAMWMVRAGKYGERDSLAIETGNALIGWDILPDFSKIESKEYLKELMAEFYPDSNKGRVASFLGQLWIFVKLI